MTPSNIHVGPGTLILNPDSSAVSIDSSSEGATLNFNAELEAINTDQVLSPVGYFIPGEECTFEMMANEGSANILRYALGATDQSVTTSAADATNKGYDEIKFGGNYVLTDYVLEYIAPRRNNKNLYIRIRLYSVNISPNLEASYVKDGVTYYKLTFKAKADTTKTAGEQLGYYRQETADVTGTTPTLAVSSSTPADDATDVAITTDIDIVFNRSVHPESVNGGNFILVDTSDNTEVSATVAFTGDAGTNVTVTPSSNLSNNTTYLLIISSKVKALEGQDSMSADVLIDFTTIAA